MEITSRSNDARTRARTSFLIRRRALDIEEHDVKAAISWVIHTDELVKVNRSVKYPPYIINTHQIENPYYFRFKAIIVLAQQQKKLGFNEPVHFILTKKARRNAYLRDGI
jgi:hypothetical protein